MTERLDLAALVGSRICHDLISPLGAIGNGVELLQMTSGPLSPELALISESVTAANARIRFYRIAYGASGNDQHLGTAEIREVLADISRGSRLSIDWQAGGDASRTDAKLAFLLIQCLENALPFGGRIAIQSSGGRWRFTGASARLRADPDLMALLQGSDWPSDIAPSKVHFALAAAEARRRGLTIETDIRSEAITIAF